MSNIAVITTSELKNSVMNQDFAQARDIAMKLVPDIFEEIVIRTGHVAIFSLGKTNSRFYMEIKKFVSASENVTSGPSVITIFFHINLFPQIIISAAIAFAALLLTIPFVILEQHKSEISMQKYYYTMSRKLAHDIRSPLSTLNLISSKIENQTAKSLQLEVIEQINQIAEDLLGETKPMVQQYYSHIFGQLEKEFSLKAISLNRVIKFKIAKELVNLAFPAPKYIYSMMNNLIQNAVDATSEGQGQINVTVRLEGNEVIIMLEDNGTGIDEKILKLLGKEELTFGKSNKGNGLGVFLANQSVRSSNGTFNISSKLETGTTITIRLPVSEILNA